MAQMVNNREKFYEKSKKNDFVVTGVWSAGFFFCRMYCRGFSIRCYNIWFNVKQLKDSEL